MNIELQLREEVRYMLLPIPNDCEDKCVLLIDGYLTELGIDRLSYSKYLRIRFEEWRTDGNLNNDFKKLIISTLKATDDQYGDLIAEKYFEIHALLLKHPFITFELAIILLNQLRLIISLASDYKMSAAKISIVLNSIDSRLSVVSWKEIQIVLRKLDLLPEVNQTDSKALYESDIILEEEYFADADMSDASFIVGEVAKNLEINVDVQNILEKLSRRGLTHIPYLQILHYQCLISGFYNHILSVPYEFSPRGNVANWLFSQWDSLVHTSNPILNNAKAVDVLDQNWARSRKTNEFEQATVLVELLQAIDKLSFLASQELAAWIRRWLVRYIRLNSTTIVPVPYALDEYSILKIINFIKEKPTGTYGILEQRFVDVCAAYLHSTVDGWRPRGLGDSVNANNLSKKKLGDCDFQDSSEKLIIAYEPHGGVLTRIYFEGHKRTFKRIFEKRKLELEGIADIKDWSIIINFIAYGFEKELDSNFEVDGISVGVNFLTFDELCRLIDISSAEFKDLFNQYFIDVINDRRTPTIVRQKVHEVCLLKI